MSPTLVGQITMLNNMKDKPRYKSRYQAELAEEITGMNYEAVRKMCQRKQITLAEAIRQIILKSDKV